MSRFDERYLNFGDVYDIIMQAKTVDQAMNVLHLPYVEMPKWIPVTERLPEDSGDYLVRPSDSILEYYSDFSEVMIMPYDADCEAFGWWVERYHPTSLGYLDSEFNECEVLAWMPLPEAYEVGDSE